VAVEEMSMLVSRRPQRSADRVGLKGITWRARPDDKLQEALKELGYDRPPLDLSYAYVNDQAAKTLDCQELTLAVQKAGKLTCSFLLKDLQDEVGGGLPQDQQAILQARPARLTLRYDDDSLTDRLLTQAARKQGLELEALRANLLQGLPPLPGAMKPEPALLRFIEKPGSLCLTITPRQEMTLAQYAALGPAVLAVLEWKLDNCQAPAGQ
jgi:hypothetical protein